MTSAYTFPNLLRRQADPTDACNSGIYFLSYLRYYIRAHIITCEKGMAMDVNEEKDQIPLFGEVTPTLAPPPPQSPPRPAPKQRVEQTPKQTAAKKVAPDGKKKTPKEVATSGQVPAGDVRLTANIREDLHLRLKIAAARQRTTIGEIIEDLVERHIPPV